MGSFLAQVPPLPPACPEQIPPAEYATLVLQALLPYYAPLVVYLVSGITVLMCIILLWRNARQARQTAVMGETLKAMADAFVEYQAKSALAIEDATMLQRQFVTETLAVQRAAATEQQRQMEGIRVVLNDFFEWGARAFPQVASPVVDPTAQLDGSKRESP